MTDPRATTAKALIAKEGQSVTWRQTRNGTPADPAKPWLVGNSAVTEYTVDIVFLPDSRFNFQGKKFYPETEVPTGFGIAYMGQQSFIPQIKDVIVRDGVELVVRNIRTTSPAGEDLLYELEIGQ